MVAAVEDLGSVQCRLCNCSAVQIERSAVESYFFGTTAVPSLHKTMQFSLVTTTVQLLGTTVQLLGTTVQLLGTTVLFSLGRAAAGQAVQSLVNGNSRQERDWAGGDPPH